MWEGRAITGAVCTRETRARQLARFLMNDVFCKASMEHRVSLKCNNWGLPLLRNVLLSSDRCHLPIVSRPAGTVWPRQCGDWQPGHLLRGPAQGGPLQRHQHSEHGDDGAS
jgi:hypothetical protein